MIHLEQGGKLYIYTDTKVYFTLTGTLSTGITSVPKVLAQGNSTGSRLIYTAAEPTSIDNISVRALTTAELSVFVNGNSAEHRIYKATIPTDYTLTYTGSEWKIYDETGVVFVNSGSPVGLASVEAIVAANSAQMISADNAISNAVSVVAAATSATVTNINQAVSVISQQVSALSARVAGNSAQATSALTSLNNIGDVSIDGVGNAQVLMFNSAVGQWIASTIGGSGSVTSTELSNAVSALSNALSAVSIRVDGNSAQMTSADNAISNAVSIVSAAQAVTSAAVTSVNQIVSAISQQVSVLSARVEGNSAQMTSADTVISNAVSIVSAAQAITSAAVTSVNQAISVISQQVSVLSARVAGNSAQMTSANASLNNIEDVSVDGVVDQQVLVFNSAAGQWLASTLVGGTASVTSAEYLSVVNRVSGNSTQMVSADDAISNAVSIVSAAQAITSAAVTSVNQIVSALSANVAGISLNISAISTKVSNVQSAVQANSAQMTSAFGSLNNIGDVSVDGATDQQALVFNSAAGQWVASTVGGSGSVTSAEHLSLDSRVSTNSAQMMSADNAISNAVSIVSVANAVTSAAVTSINQVVSVISVGLAATQSVVAANSAQMTSADNAISNAVSVLSVQLSLQVSALSQVHSALSANVATISLNVSAISTRLDAVSVLASNAQSIANAVSIRAADLTSNLATLSTNVSAKFTSVMSAVSTESAARAAADTSLDGRVTSVMTAVSTNSAQMTSADNAISNAVSIVSAAQAVTSAAVTSVNQIVSVISQQVSVLSVRVAGNSAQMTSALGALDNIGNVSVPSPGDVQVLTWSSAQGQWVASTITAGVGSVTSAEVVAGDDAVSAAGLSANQTLSATMTSADNAVSAAAASANTTIMQQVSVISAGFGSPQLHVVGDKQSISVSVLANISGLSVSVAANQVYKINAELIYNVSAISVTGFQFALLASGMTQQTATGNWQGTSALAVSTGGTAIALVNQPFNGLNSAFFSVVSAGTAAINRLKLEALIVTSTTGGSLQLSGRVTIGTTSMYIYKGSYIQAIKLNGS